jgi:hypothetical protein
LSARASPLAAIDARRSSLGGAPDHATPAPDLTHPAARAKHPCKDGRDVVIYVEQGPVEARSRTFNFDLRELPRRSTLKTLEQLARDSHLDTRCQRDDHRVIGQAIDSGDGLRPLSFRLSRILTGADSARRERRLRRG